MHQIPVSKFCAPPGVSFLATSLTRPQSGLGSIQFRNWNWFNWSSISIPILELELKLVELKMEFELKSLELELELKTGIGFFCNCYCNTYYLLVNQPFPNFSFKRGGHNLSCDWLVMQQVCLLSSWDIAPCGVVTKKHGEGNLYPLSRQRSEGLKMVTINISLPPWHKQNYCHCWIN